MSGPRTVLSEIRAGYGRRSAVALAVLVTVYSSIGYRFSNLIHPELGMDWLLAFTWVALTGLVIWRPEPRRDAKLLFVGLCGGAVIETWGTYTNLWHYFTYQRPPPWILPAWPIAALAIDRLARWVDLALPAIRRADKAYWVVMPVFIAWMTWFSRPALTHPTTLGVVALMIGVWLWRPRPDRDLVLFVAGAGMGVFLEYWGTSRKCWTYWTAEIPPPVAVFAHGFASIAFSRAVTLLDVGLGRLSGGQTAQDATKQAAPGRT
jgi:hypothetical protein